MRTDVLFCLRWVVTTLSLVLLLGAHASAQSIVDATKVEFTPSTDHNTVDNGVNVVTSYSLEVYTAGGSTVIHSVSLGKPSPGTDGLIRLDFVSLLPSPLTPGVIYEVLVQAVGPGGSSGGTRSNTFAFTPTCGSPSVTPLSQSVVAAGGTGSATVTAAAGCGWTAVSNDTWITVTGGANSTGPGSASFSVAPNTVTTPRTGTLTIAGATFTVNQAAAACSYAITSTGETVPAAGGTASTSVTTSANCAWTTSESVNWITISSGASGTGPGPVTLTVAANTGTSPRSAVVTIAGKSFTVTQPAPTCTVTLTPTSVTVVAAGGTNSITVGTQSTCAWTSSSNVAWITATASGTGSGNASYTVAANNGTTGRTGTFTIGGVTVTVTQGVKPAAPTNVKIVR